MSSSSSKRDEAGAAARGRGRGRGLSRELVLRNEQSTSAQHRVYGKGEVAGGWV